MDESQKDSEQKSGLAKEIRLYVEKRIQLTSVTIAEQVSLMIAQSLQKLIGILLLSSALLFLWLALSFYLGDLVNNTALGFLISALPLFLFGFIFSRANTKKITERIQADLIIKMMSTVEESLQLNKADQEESSEEK